MSNIRKLRIKQLGTILTISIVVSLTLDIVINSYVLNYFFGTITLAFIGFWIIVAIVDFFLRLSYEERNLPEAGIVIQVDDGYTKDEPKEEANDYDY